MGDAIAEPELPAAGGSLQTAKDLFSGAMGGLAQVLIGKLPEQRWRLDVPFCVCVCVCVCARAIERLILLLLCGC
jgi:hypothetical protein